MHTAKINYAQSSKRGDVSAKVIVKASLEFSQSRNQIPLYQTSLAKFNLQILETRFCIRHRGVNIIFWQINSFLNNVHFLPHLFLNNCKYQTLQMEDLLAPRFLLFCTWGISGTTNDSYCFGWQVRIMQSLAKGKGWVCQ